MRLSILVVLFVFLTGESSGQYFQFSQYNFTFLRINPALAGASNYASVSLLYRNQGTEGGFHLKSTSLNAIYPLVNARKGLRWGGLGIGFMDDRSGSGGIFERQEASLAYAVNVFVAKRQSLSLGIRGLYQSTRINLDHLYTGLQYVTDRGFNESVSNGEGDLQARNSHFTLAAGLHWEKTDRDNNRLAYAGISFFDINKPDHAFVRADRLSTTFVGSGGFQLYRKNNVSFNPDMLISHSASGANYNIGMATCYALNKGAGYSRRILLLTRYTVGRHGMIGLQFHNEVYSWGISYDFPVFKKNVANTGALEMGIEIHQFRRKGKRRRIVSPQRRATIKMATVISTPREKVDTQEQESVEMSMSERLRSKRDSLLETTDESMERHHRILERAVLHVKFDFNSTGLDAESLQYFDELAVALLDNPDLRLQLVGHTDNVGSDRYNLALSLRRANAIKDYLIERGVEEIRISVEGKGLREPLNGNRTDEDRAANRRVEVVIVYQAPED